MNLYRPALVDVKVNDEILTNVLTFLVISKGAETAPSSLYATEILRGGKKYLSDSYFKRLENHIRSLGTTNFSY